MRLLKTLLLPVAAVLVGFLIAEGFARLAFPEWAPRSARLAKLWEYDARLGWKHLPGVTSSFRSYGFDTNVRINSKGFRGPEVGYPRESGAARILVIGDSFVWGYGVEYEEMFTTLLQQRLPGMEFINLGVSGYSTDQELLLYQDEGRKYGADHIILVVVDNDFGANARTVESVIYGKPMFRLQNGDLHLVNQPVDRAPWWKAALVRLSWHSYVLTNIHRALYEIRADVRSAGAKAGRSAATGDDVTREFPRSEGQIITARLLREFKEITAADGAELLLVFVGGRQSRKMAAYLARFGIDSVVLDEYVDPNDPALHLFDQLHWTPEAHKIVADVLAQKLR